MAQNDQGWNQLVRDPQSFMTDVLDTGDGVNVHDTFRFNTDGDAIGRSHTTVEVDGQFKRLNHDW